MSSYGKILMACSLFGFLILHMNVSQFHDQNSLSKRRNIDYLASSKEDIFEFISVKCLNSAYMLIGLNNMNQVAKPFDLSDEVQTARAEEIPALLKFFYENNVFLIDTELLEGLYNDLTGILNNKMGLVNFNKMGEFKNRTIHLKKINTSTGSEKVHINFGISMDNFERFHSVSTISVKFSFISFNFLSKFLHENSE